MTLVCEQIALHLNYYPPMEAYESNLALKLKLQKA